MKRVLIIIGAVVLISQVSCEKFLEIDSPMFITEKNAIIDLETATEAVFGLYNSMQLHGNYGIYQIVLSDVVSDVVSSGSTLQDFTEYDRNNIRSTNPFLLYLWKDPYNAILQANYILEKVHGLNNIPEATKRQFFAEAKFIRALAHFNLLSKFGDIPFISTTNPDIIKTSQRMPVEVLIDSVLTDLNYSVQNLPVMHEAVGNHFPEHVSRTRAVRDAARGLIARVSLFRNAGQADIERVIEQTGIILESSFFQLESDYSDAFTPFSTETIFSIYFDASDPNYISLQTTPGQNLNYLPSSKLLEYLTSNPQDTRRHILAVPTGERFYCKKYQSRQSHVVVIRLSDIILMRAEAYALKGDAVNASHYLNIIRNRAGIAQIPENIDPVQLREIILQERFVEFAFEGHRFYDLKRSGKIDEVMRQVNPETWESTDALFPLPFLEVQGGLTQNPGY
jgi:starch-binding outer membrane protein, SusD/RagB family